MIAVDRRRHGVHVIEGEQRAEQPSECREVEEEEEEAAEGDAFHSLRHVKPFAREATMALDKVEGAARKGAHRRRGSSVAPHRSVLTYVLFDYGTVMFVHAVV